MATRKIMLSVPDETRLRRIDGEARRRGMSRSAFMLAAAEREVARATPEETENALADMRAIMSNAAPFDATAAIREGRDALDARDAGRR